MSNWYKTAKLYSLDSNPDYGGKPIFYTCSNPECEMWKTCDDNDDSGTGPVTWRSPFVRSGPEKMTDKELMEWLDVKSGKVNSQISHGFCPECLAKEKLKIQ